MSLMELRQAAIQGRRRRTSTSLRVDAVPRRRPGTTGVGLKSPPSGFYESREGAELVSVYFDTQRLKLRKKGVSLRLRHIGGQHLQAIKLNEPRMPRTFSTASTHVGKWSVHYSSRK
jgi:hypothetical protein